MVSVDIQIEISEAVAALERLRVEFERQIGRMRTEAEVRAEIDAALAKVTQK